MEHFVIFFCLAITLHNMEEALWLPAWSQQASRFQKPVTSNEFHFAVLVITILAYLSSFSYLIMPELNLSKWIFAGFLGSMIFNAIFPHLISTILMKKYAPGLATGLFLNIPINSVILYQMFAENTIGWRGLFISTIAVGISLLACIPLLFKAGRKLLVFNGG